MKEFLREGRCKADVIVLKLPGIQQTMTERNIPDMTRFSSEQLNVALDMSLEWGEYFLVPVNERILKMYPDLTAEDAECLNRWCDEVKNYAVWLKKIILPVPQQQYYR